MAMSTDTDVLAHEPNILDYGIQSFADEHAKTRADILRILRIDWWPRHRNVLGKYTINIIDVNLEMDDTKLTESQFTRAAVYHVLAYYILPKLSKFTPEGDVFREKMEYYRSRFNEEIDYILRDGPEYDFDGDGVVEDSEKQPVHYGRLVR
jgi:hypothetical protein|tara:strand:+ start:51 stop:503 length:453 start_codon:yes stop_codon:yes gene_type:complete